MNQRQIKQLSDILKNTGLLLLGAFVISNMLAEKLNVILLIIGMSGSILFFYSAILLLGGKEK